MFTVLLSLALFALAHGLLVSARAEYSSARALADLSAREALADGGADRAEASAPGSWMDSVPIGGARTVVDSSWSDALVETRWRRITPEGWLTEVQATDARGRVARARRAVWGMDPVTRSVAFPATVSVGPDAPVSVSGSVEPLDGAAVAVVGSAGLGRMTFERILGLAVALPPILTPAPVTGGGVCDATDPTNWGDPARPFAPCGDHVAFVGRAGDVVVVGGAGRVVLVVEGDVALRDGADVRGLILASGTLGVTGGARFRGLAVAMGGLDVDATSVVAASREEVRTVLEATRGRVDRWVRLHRARRLDPG